MRFFQPGEWKLLWPFYLDALLSPMLFFLPVFMIIYFRELGLSLFQISLLTMMLPLFALLLEIPTGAIADLYGRKLSVMLGALIQGLAMIMIFFVDNYSILLLAFALMGVGSAFNSGAREAWITDLVKKKGLLHDYFVKSSSLDSFGLVVSGLVGAWAVKALGISVIWIVAGLSFFITFLLLGLAKENFLPKAMHIKYSWQKIGKQALVSLQYARNHPVLFLFLLAASILAFGNVFNGDLAWIPLLQELNLPTYAFGYLWSAMGVVGVFAPHFSLKLMKKGRERKFILSLIVLTIILLLFIVLVRNLTWAFVILLASIFLGRLSFPSERVYFHRFIQNRLRATVGSIESMVIGFIGIVALPLAGLSVDHWGARYTIFLSALLMIPAAFLFLKIKDGKR